MKNSQLITVFLGLNGTEKRAINKIVLSPFFNQRQEVIDLWRYLVEHSKEGIGAYSKEKVYRFVFGEEDYNDKKMRHVSSWLLQCIEEYFSYTAYKRTPVNESLHCAQIYKEKKLEKYFQKTIKKGQQQLNKMYRGPDAFYFDFQLKFENYRYVESRNRSNVNNLQQMTVALDKHLIMSKLKQACIMSSHKSVFTTEYNFKLVKLLLDFLPNSTYMDEPGIACYYYCYRALEENDESCFQNLRKILQTSEDSLPADDVSYLYFSAINFCIRRMNTGDSKYRRETFELYKSGLENNVLIETGEISRFAYNNIVTTGLTLHEFDWLENFIHIYKPMINPRHRESNFNYNLAQLHFKRKEYDKALQYLIHVDERDLLLHLDTKVLLLKIYFEQNEFEALSSLLSSFSVMLGRKKVLQYHKQHYLNIIRFTNRILNLKPGDKNLREKLKHDIATAEILGLEKKEWLLQQLN